MTNWNNSKKRPKIFTKEFWKEYKWQDILINLLIYFAVFSSLLLIDLLTKWGLYIGDKPNEILANYKILGIRSLLHRGTTLEIGLTLPGLHTITFLIIISTILFSALAKKKYYRWWIAGLATIAAGSMGNMVDRFIFKGVRDVFFLPFADLGTFNFADVCIIFGSIGFVVSAVTFSLIEIYKEKRKKSISEDFENELDENDNNESTETKKNIETNKQIKSNTFNNSEINEEKPISKE